MELCLVSLTVVCDKDNIGLVCGFKALNNLVALFQLVLAAHAEGKGSDLLEIAFLCDEYIDSVILNVFLCVVFLNLMVEHDLCLSWGRILLDDVFKLLDDDFLDLFDVVDCGFKVGNFLFKVFNIGDAIENILLVDISQLDFSHIFSLKLVDAEANHKIRHNESVFLCFTDDFDSLVDIEKDFLKTL